ncbi:MAG TPA: ABC transporter ATP-binding protein [Candidatus Dormibacteraeota bacterium]|nr:ABC transporter ATP-binding protein [Candidatus Dormibacteraeota bacterium]
MAFEGVERRFGGLVALRRLTLKIGAGQFVALLGPNGSGKTTLLRMAALLLQPTAGRVRHLGAENLEAEAVRSQIGLVAHKALVYDELTAQENLSFFARLYGLPNPAERIERALGEVGLAHRSGDAAATFSRGMRQRLAIARALVTGPRLLLFDEPATGLDREGRQWLDRTLLGLNQAGATLIVSTHDESLAELAGRSVWLRAGRLVHDTGASAPQLAREVPL